MLRTLLKSKIHRATVTESNLDYVGSLTIDSYLMELADIKEYEQIQVLNISNGNRLTTYSISGKRNSGVICANGAASHQIKKGDLVIIVSYAQLSEEEIKNFKPKVVHVDKNNKPDLTGETPQWGACTDVVIDQTILKVRS